MSCRILPGAAPVQPVSWPTTGGSPVGSPTFAGAPKLEAPSNDLASQARLAELESQMERRIRDAHAAGVAEGRLAGAREVEAAMQRVAKSADELSRLKARLRKEAEADLLKLTFAVAQRILRRELTVDSDALQGVLRAALERLQVRDLLQVRVHPSHESIVRQTLSAAGAKAVAVSADDSLQIGDVFFDTPRGTMDASVDSQLREIENGFADVLAR